MIFTYSNWLRLPIITRVKIAQALGIPKSGPTHVQDNMVVSDGYDVHAVDEAITVEALQKLTRSEEVDIARLFDLLINQIDGRTNDQIDDAPKVIDVPKKRGRPFKNKV